MSGGHVRGVSLRSRRCASRRGGVQAIREGLSIVALRISLEHSGDQPVNARWSGRRHGWGSPRGAPSGGDTTASQVVLNSCDHVTRVGLMGGGASAPRLAFSGEVILEADLVGSVFRDSVWGGLSPAVLESDNLGESRARPTGQEGLVRTRVHHRAVGGGGAGRAGIRAWPSTAHSLLSRVELRHLGANGLHPSIRDSGKAVVRLDAEELGHKGKIGIDNGVSRGGVTGGAEPKADHVLVVKEDLDGNKKTGLFIGVKEAFELQNHRGNLGD